MQITPFWKLTAIALAPLVVWVPLTYYVFVYTDTLGPMFFAIVFFIFAVAWFLCAMPVAIAAARPGFLLTRVLKTVALILFGSVCVFFAWLFSHSLYTGSLAYLLFLIACVGAAISAFALLNGLLLPPPADRQSDDRDPSTGYRPSSR